MASIISGYEYDIFISYRQKDNLGDQWVTHFVEALKNELEATFKEHISIYFDENPHDGLRDAHDVDASLEEKVKCLIFIPILSRTYCDPQCFAWNKEFLPFLELASHDQYGLKVRLPNGNVISRVLPVRIHDLDEEDTHLFEEKIHGVIRSIDFVYAESGVNRPLRKVDQRATNLNKTGYLNQLNKVGNSIHEIIKAIRSDSIITEDIADHKNNSADKEKTTLEKPKYLRYLAFLIPFVLVFCIILFWSDFFPGQDKPLSPQVLTLAKTIAVMPFDDLSPDKDQSWFAEGLSEEIINSLYRVAGLKVSGRNSSFALKDKGLTIKQYADSLHVNYVVEGSVRKDRDQFRITVQLINATNDRHMWSKQYDINAGDVFKIQSEIAEHVAEVFNIYFDDIEQKRMSFAGTDNIEAYEYFLKGRKTYNDWHDTDLDITLWEANKLLSKALEIDPKISPAYYYSADAYLHFFQDEIDGPKDMILSKDVAWQYYTWNMKQAIKYQVEPTPKLLYEIEYKMKSSNWEGLDKLINEAISSFKPSAYAYAEYIIPLAFALKGKNSAIKILEPSIAQDPSNQEYWTYYANILRYDNEYDEAALVVEKLRKLDDSHYAAGVFKNVLMQGADKQRLDSILNAHLDSEDFPWFYNYWTGAFKSEYATNADTILNEPYPSGWLNALNYFWQYGEKEKVASAIKVIDQKLVSGLKCSDFFIDLTRRYGFFIPFEIDQAPNFKRKLLNAGIDPNVFKPMPRFKVFDTKVQ